MDLEILKPEEVLEKEKLLIAFLLENDFLFKSIQGGLLVRIPPVRVMTDNDSPTD